MRNKLPATGGSIVCVLAWLKDNTAQVTPWVLFFKSGQALSFDGVTRLRTTSLWLLVLKVRLEYERHRLYLDKSCFNVHHILTNVCLSPFCRKI